MFLAVAVERVSTDGILTIEADLIVENAARMPIGDAARGNWPKAGSVLVGGHHASRLFGLMRTRSQDQRMELHDYLKKLLETYDCEIAFIFHTFRGTLMKETVEVKSEVRVPFVRLKKTLDNLQEDVRYIVFWTGWPPKDFDHNASAK